MAHTVLTNRPAKRDRIQFNDIVAFILIVLFLYVGMSKLFEFEKFKETFEFIPFFRPFSAELAVAVPLIEIMTALLFIKEKFRKVAIVTSSVLILSFTIFTIIISNHAGKTPCTCGGVIQHLSWKQHLYLNIGLLVLATLGIVFPLKK